MAIGTGASMGALTGAMKGLTISIQSSSSAFVSAGAAAPGGGGGASELFSAGGCSSSTTPAGRHGGPGVAPLIIEAAHKKGAGSTKNGRDSNPKMLGVKIYGDQIAKPGAIIVRQRGTKYHPGNNVGLGRDYTIFSLIDGLVKFEKFGPDRKKISVYPNLVEKVENPDSRRVKRREAFRAKREKRKAIQLSRIFGSAGFEVVDADLQLASIPECDEESEETVVC